MFESDTGFNVQCRRGSGGGGLTAGHTTHQYVVPAPGESLARFSLACWPRKPLPTPTPCVRGPGTRDGRARRRGELRNAPRALRGVCATSGEPDSARLQENKSGSLSRAKFATEEKATVAITALWVQKEKYKGDASKLVVLEARNCTATSEDDDDSDEQRPTTVMTWKSRPRDRTSCRLPPNDRTDWKRDQETSQI